jgi:serralysin
MMNRTYRRVAGSASGAFGLARYNPDGSLDPTFGVSGVVTTRFDIGSSDDARALLIQPDGKVVLAGTSMVGINADFALARR